MFRKGKYLNRVPILKRDSSKEEELTPVIQIFLSDIRFGCSPSRELF